MDLREEQFKKQEAMDIEKFLPTTTDPKIIEELYKETPIIEVLTLEDLLKLEVNEDYKKNALHMTEERFKLKKISNDIINDDISAKN